MLNRARALGADPGALRDVRALLAASSSRPDPSHPYRAAREFLSKRVAPLLARAVMAWIAGGLLVAQSAAGLAGAILIYQASVSFLAVAQFASATIAGGLAIFGLLRLRAARRVGLRWMRYAALVTVLCTEVFDFIDQEFAALIGVIVGVFALTIVAIQLRGGVDPD
jgi:hypothetical protein